VTPLGRRIADLIGALGPIPVSEYMALCLSDPTHGYYTTRQPFGASGDFVTAPEISQMFGELVGVWLLAAWQALGRPERPLIAEIGPGRGTLMRDIARTLGKIGPELRRQARFHLIETSDRLARTQAATLRSAGGRFDWHEHVGDLPADGPLLIVGNEIFDAIPMRQYQFLGGVWRERLVGLDDRERLGFVAGAGTLDPALLPPDATPLEGAIHETAPARSALMQAIAARIAAHGGCGLFFDYGHLSPGFGDTFQALRRHSPEDVFASPGEADLTSHVDFSALAEAGRGEGLDVHLSTQGDFLLGLGLLERAGRLGADAGAARRESIRAEVQRLAGPDQMGELFKVIAIMPKGLALPPFTSG
jgi:SAM-dependent MidA family methyltransferase